MEHEPIEQPGTTGEDTRARDHGSGAQADAARPEDVSRRRFLVTSALGAGAATVAGRAFAATAADTGIPSIRIPKDLTDSLGAPAQPPSFADKGMTGAEVFARACKEEGLAALFCCPGNYTVIHAIAAEGVPSYGGRTEGSMCAAADGFSRATGEVVAASGTEGPGFTNMIMNVAAAHAARTPLLVLASNMTLAGEDREAYIQQVYQQPTTEGMRKYGKRLIAANRVHEYAGYAFRQLKSGVPGPVHLDFPAEVARAHFADPSELTDYYDKSHYRTESRAFPSKADVDRALDLIARSERPLLVAGQGVFQRRGWEALQAAAEKNDLAVVGSGPTRGHFPDEHRLSAALAPDALMSADLVIFVGQYCMPSPGEYRFNPDVKTIRVHPVQEDLGRNWPLDLGIVSDERHFLEALADRLPQRRREAWVTELATARAAFEEQNAELYRAGLRYSRQTETLHPAVIGHEINQFLYHGSIDPKQTVTTGGGWTIGRFAGRFMRAHRPAQSVVAPYQYGAIGPDLAMAIGTGAAVQRGAGPQRAYRGAPVFCVTSDAGMAYSLFELETATKYRIPTIAVVYNNDSWGTWPSAAQTPQAMHLHLFQENLRYDKLAEGLGAHGEYVRTPEELRAALDRGYRIASAEGLSTLINCQAKKEFTSPRDFPPGPPLNAEPGVAAAAH